MSTAHPSPINASERPLRRGSPRLVRELSVFIALKLILLFALYWAFFSPVHRIAPDGNSVANWLLASPQQPSH